MTSFLQRALLFTALIICAGAQSCPDDWIQYGYSCYVFIDEFVPWTSAKVYCDIIDASMLQVETKEENDFIAEAIRNRTGIQSAWIGLNDLVHEGRWVWNSNKAVTEFTNWAPGMPDNHHQHENGEDCVQILPDGTWNDLWCEDFQHDPAYLPSPVCEISANEEELVG